MATVRTVSGEIGDVVVCAGFGVRDHFSRVRAFAEELGATLVTTRKMVDNGFMPYEQQVGLTGKTVTPPVYIAIGVSGAVHHIMGMQRAGTVIAINPDKDAPIFDYADFGIVAEF
jgi:electron transfer flavoprotein alpha subunit